MRVRDLMTPDPLTVSPDDSLERVVGVMAKHSIRELPVQENGALVGIITERDVKMALGPDSRTMNLDAIDPRQLSGSVDWFMTQGAETIGVDDTLATAIDALLSLRVGAMPVTDDAGALVGILSVTDVLRAARELLGESTH